MNAVRDGESVLMGVTDENECHLWVMALYRATGQSHKPTPPTTSDLSHHKIMGGESKRDNEQTVLIFIKLGQTKSIFYFHHNCAIHKTPITY